MYNKVMRGVLSIVNLVFYVLYVTGQYTLDQFFIGSCAIILLLITTQLDELIKKIKE